MIVVNPLKANIPSAVAPKKLPRVPASPGIEKSIDRESAIQTPTSPKVRIPPIFRIPINDATPWIIRLPSRLTRKTARMSDTPRTGTIR